MIRRLSCQHGGYRKNSNCSKWSSSVPKINDFKAKIFRCLVPPPPPATSQSEHRYTGESRITMAFGCLETPIARLIHSDFGVEIALNGRKWFVRNLQKTPIADGGMSLGKFGRVVKYRRKTAMSLSANTAVSVWFEHFEAPRFLSVYSSQTGRQTTGSMVSSEFNFQNIQGYSSTTVACDICQGISPKLWLD